MINFFSKKKTSKVYKVFSLETIEMRWMSSNIDILRSLGFDLPNKYFDWIISRNERFAKCSIEGGETFDFWPLDEENFNHTSGIAEFPSMTIGVFESGSHIIMGLAGSPSNIMFIDNDGKNNKIYKKLSYEEFFNSLINDLI
jgi:hypothetical protein